MALLEKTILEATSDFELRIPMGYEQFLTELDESVHAEWVSGETILFMPPTPEHQDVVSFLLALIRFYVDYFKLGKVLRFMSLMTLDNTALSSLNEMGSITRQFCPISGSRPNGFGRIRNQAR